MSGKNERLDITMRILGARQVEKESEKVGKGIKGVGSAASRTSAATSKTARATSALTRSYSQLGKAARYGIGFLGVGGIYALKSAVVNTEELAKSTSGFNRNLGLSVKESSRWASLAHARGIETTTLTMGLGKLGKAFLEANRKGGTSRTALNQLGITYNQTEKGAHNLQYALDVVAGAFGRAKAGPERQTAAMALLGKGYKDVLPLFADGRQGLEEQLHWADKYGSTLNGKSLKGVMAMVTAQREFKAAMFGLQIQATKYLTPAIHAVDDQLGQLTSTLANPKLTTDQKLSRITNQFLKIEDTVFKLGEQALPRFADQWEEMGVKLVGALALGFLHSDLIGKIIISAWLIRALGGLAVVEIVGGRIGKKLAVGLGTKFLETVAPYFAAEAGVEGLGSALSSRMGGLTTLFGGKGRILGKAMGVFAAGALVAEIVYAVENSEDIAGLSLFNTPKVGATSIEEEAKRLTEMGYTGIGFNSGHELEGTTPSGKHITEVIRNGEWVTKGRGKVITASGPRDPVSHRRGGAHRDASHAPRRRESAYQRPIVIHNKIIMDGKQVAESVAKHSFDAAALAH